MKDAEEMLQLDLEYENETVAAYRERVRQCEAWRVCDGRSYIREILIQEQEHQIDLATALGKDVYQIRCP
jgi:bacterioferritin